MGKITYLAVKKRIAVLFLAATMVVIFLAFRMVYLQIYRTDWLSSKAWDQRMRPIQVDAKRGTIYDRNGLELAVSISRNAVYAVPAEVRDPEGTAEKLASILNLRKEFIRERITRFSAAEWIKKQITPEQAKAVRYLGLPGIGVVENPQRYYPSGPLAAQVIGFSGIDNQGLEGLELWYDEYLRGRPGMVITERDATGYRIKGGSQKYVPAQEGDSLILTIDKRIQQLAERELARALADTGSKNGTIVVMDPNNGEILAMAAQPGYNPNSFEDYPAENRRNMAITDEYEPGSTWKAVTAAVALEEGITTLERYFFDPGFIIVGGWTINCWAGGGHGSQSFVETLQNSCNPVFAQLGMELGDKRFYRYIRAFGFGEPSGVDFPGEAPGSVREPGTVGLVTWANIGFGQGMTLTPLQLLNAYAAIVNGGFLLRPHLVKEIRKADGTLVKRFGREVIRQVISKKTSDTMRFMLRSAIANGSGKRADVPGYRVGGKTGTSQLVEGGAYSHSKMLSSFAGVAPADDPRMVGIITLREPQGEFFGGVIVAPVFARLGADLFPYMKIPPKMEPKPKTITGSKGEKQVVVPNVRYYNTPDALAALTAAGLRVKQVGKGEIIVDQVPKGGAQVALGTAVILYPGPLAMLDQDLVPPLQDEQHGARPSPATPSSPETPPTPETPPSP